MTSTTSNRSTSTPASRTTPGGTTAPAAIWPKVAGLAYVGAWTVGLTAFGAGPGADASEQEIASHVAAHRASSALQSLLVHGVAAVGLAAVLVAITRRVAIGRVGRLAGVGAVALSLLQCTLGLWRSCATTGSATVDLVRAIDLLDGVKMLALAVTIGASLRPLRSASVIGRPMHAVGAAAAIALTFSGVAYAGTIGALLDTAAIALVLLLVWVARLGFVSARSTSCPAPV